MKILSVFQKKGLWIFSLCKLIQCMELEDVTGLTTIGSDKIGSNESRLAGSNSVSRTSEKGKKIKTDSFSSGFNEIKDDENKESMDFEASSSSISRPFRSTGLVFDSTEEEKRIANGLKPIRQFSKQFGKITIDQGDQGSSIKNDYQFIHNILVRWNRDFVKTKIDYYFEQTRWKNKEKISETFEFLLKLIKIISPKKHFYRRDYFDVQAGEESYEHSLNRLSPFQRANIYRTLAKNKIYQPTNLPETKIASHETEITLEELQNFVAGYMKHLLSFEEFRPFYKFDSTIDYEHDGVRREFELRRIIILVINYMLKYKMIKEADFVYHFDDWETLDICATTMVMNYVIKHGAVDIACTTDILYSFPSSKLMPGTGEFSDFSIFTEILSQRGQMIFSHLSLSRSIFHMYSVRSFYLPESSACVREFSNWKQIEVLQSFKRGEIKYEDYSCIQRMDEAYQILINSFLSDPMTNMEKITPGRRIVAFFMLQFLHDHIGEDVFEIKDQEISNHHLKEKLEFSASVFEFMAEINNISSYMKSYLLQKVDKQKKDYWILESGPKSRYSHAKKILPCIEGYAENLTRKYQDIISKSMNPMDSFFMNQVIQDSMDFYKETLQETKKKFLPRN